HEPGVAAAVTMPLKNFVEPYPLEGKRVDLDRQVLPGLSSDQAVYGSDTVGADDEVGQGSEAVARRFDPSRNAALFEKLILDRDRAGAGDHADMSGLGEVLLRQHVACMRSPSPDDAAIVVFEKRGPG